MQELHDDVGQRQAFVGARVERADDVVARDGARGLGFAREAHERRVILRRETARDHLRGKTLSVCIFDFVDRAHAAASDDAHDSKAFTELVPHEPELVRIVRLELDERWCRGA